MAVNRACLTIRDPCIVENSTHGIQGSEHRKLFVENTSPNMIRRITPRAIAFKIFNNKIILFSSYGHTDVCPS